MSARFVCNRIVNMSNMSNMNASVIDPGSGRTSTASRLAHVMRRRIAEGEWAAGDRLPSEPALAKELGASRVSLRGALALLENDGLVVRRHGAGTFVNTRRPLVNSLHVNRSADQMITSTGRAAATAELSWRRVPAEAEVARRLEVAEGSPVVRLHRVRTADERPVVVSDDYLPAALLADQPALLGPSLYAFLSAACGIEVSFGVTELTPATADAAVAHSLGVEPGELCLLIRQVDYDAAEHPVVYSIEHHLASAFTFELIRRGPADPNLPPHA
jgi:DNA-binding GntR family transcriptional regulator